MTEEASVATQSIGQSIGQADLLTAPNNRHRSAILWWLLLIVGAGNVVAFSWVGDLQSAEAAPLLRTEAHGFFSFAALLAALERLIGSALDPAWLRLASTATVLVTVFLILLCLDRWIGRTGALAAALAGLFSLPALLVSTTATPDALVALLVVMGSMCLVARPHSSHAAGFQPRAVARIVAGAILLLLAVGLLLNLPAGPGNVSGHPGFWFLLLSLPWGPVALASVWSLRNAGWTPAARSLGLLAFGLGAAALVGESGWPALGLSWSWLLALAGSLVVGTAWEQWENGRLPVAVQRRLAAAWATVVLGSALIAIVGGTLRIAVRFQLMERVEVLVVVGLGALALGIALLQHQRWEWSWLSVAGILVAAKFVLVSVYLPERDELVSTRPYAEAIGRCIPAGATVYTGTPLDPGFHYYFHPPVAPLDPSVLPTAPAYALISADDTSATATRIAAQSRLIRTFEGKTPARLLLYALEPTPQ